MMSVTSVAISDRTRFSQCSRSLRRCGSQIVTSPAHGFTFAMTRLLACHPSWQNHESGSPVTIFQTRTEGGASLLQGNTSRVFACKGLRIVR